MKDFTDITVVLDRSGSMQNVKPDTIGGFNSFLESQQKTPGKGCLTLVQFDDEYQVDYEGLELDKAPILNNESYQPRGMTALLDAIGKTIVKTGERLSKMSEEDRPDKVIFVIQTDGGENCSKEYNRETVFHMIRYQEKMYRWEFIFLGANQDAIKAGVNMGFKSGSSLTYIATGQGTKRVFRSMSDKVSGYRGMSSAAREQVVSGAACMFDDDDRAVNADDKSTEDSK